MDYSDRGPVEKRRSWTEAVVSAVAQDRATVSCYLLRSLRKQQLTIVRGKPQSKGGPVPT